MDPVTESFSNRPIALSELPRYEEVGFLKPSPRYYYVVALGTFSGMSITGLIAAFALYTAEQTEYWVLALLIWLGLLLFLLVWSYVGFKRKGFAFREHDVMYRRGVLATITTIIPYSRIQHVALKEGVFSRVLGLAQIGIFTAGGGSSDIEIPGIEKTRAEEMKQFVLEKIQQRQ